jgi:hypothetical protein
VSAGPFHWLDGRDGVFREGDNPMDCFPKDADEMEAWAIEPLLLAGLRRHVELRWAALHDPRADPESPGALFGQITRFTLFWVPVHPSVGRAARVVDIRPDLRDDAQQAWRRTAEENARLYVAWNGAGQRRGPPDTWEGPFQSAVEARRWMDEHTVPEHVLRWDRRRPR